MIPFSPAIQQKIDVKFEQAKNRFGSRREEILDGLEKCTSAQRQCMKFFYAYMPTGDIGAYSFQTLLGFADHGIFLRENVDWCAKVPEEIFLNYVLWYRVNNEGVEDCRHRFYEAIHPVLDEWQKKETGTKTMADAVLEVNYWCFTQATYQLTDDRTVCPTAMLNCAYGRCGEESTFAVTALRSVGIPARQVYAPRWSHCDDNHAWVEVWCDGKWHYSGACEPEPVLDKGWFTAAASRAMLIHSRCFSDAVSEEEIAGNDGAVTVCNHTNSYGDTRLFTVEVTKDRQPLPGVTITFQVINYADYSTIATLVTDEHGKVSLTMGLGFIAIHAEKDGKFLSTRLNTQDVDSLQLDFGKASEKQHENTDGESFVAEPPKDHMPEAVILSDEKKQAARERYDACAAKRHQKEAGFISETTAKERLEQLGVEASDPLYEIAVKSLVDARGNAPQIEEFLQAGKESGKLPLYIKMLGTLSKKDKTDLSSAVLEDHIKLAKAYQDAVPENLYIPYILSPRVDIEQMVSWRQNILNTFVPNEQEEFRKDPKKVWEWCCENCDEDPDHEYGPLITDPSAMLRVRTGSKLSRKILFVAICRTLGIPSRLSPETSAAQYYDGKEFIPVEKEQPMEQSTLILESEDDTEWNYTQNWSMSMLSQGEYTILNFADYQWENGKLHLTVPVGDYRLVTANRMPNGSVFSREYRFSTKGEKETKIKIALEQTSLSDLLENITLPAFQLHEEDGTVIESNSLYQKKTILVWAEESKEPTEHILNEMMDSQERYNAFDGEVVMIIRDKKALSDPTLSKALSCLKKVRICYDDFRENVQTLARRTYVDPDKLPLVIAVKPGGTAVYAFSGYNVGMGELLLKILDVAESEA